MSAVHLEALREKLAAQPSVTEMFGPLYKPCGHIWRPADVPTNGVAAVKTAGRNDSAIKGRA